jgi:PAS domain S-box-containing protein
VDANKPAQNFYGYSLQTLKEMTIQDIYVLMPVEIARHRKEAVHTQQNYFVFPHRLVNGEIRTVEVHSSPIAIGGRQVLFSIIHDITERKRAEEMLRLQMAIMETAAEGIFLIGLEDNIIKWTNSKFEQLFGYGPGEMVGMHVDKVNAPTEKTPTETRLSIVDILRQTGEWHGEIKSIKKNGTHFWSYIHVSLFNHPEFGTVMVSAHTDITDRKQAEAALQESELRFRTMANAIPQMAWIARADGYIFWYNQRWHDYTGTVPEQMEGWDWQNVHDPNVLQEVLERWQVSLETSEPFDMTFPLRGADGVFRPFLTRVIPLKDNAGRIMQWFGTNTDISELKRVEQALRESEALYRSIGESIDYGVWICEPDGRNTYASESFLKMVGITQEQCSNFGWGNVLHPDDAERTITAWQECVRTGGTWDIEHLFRGTDGKWHHVLARGVPVRNEQGKIIKWAGINLDINRIKQAEEQIRASLAEKEVLLKEIHHRVKNNLQVISSLISLQADSMADEQMQGVLGDVRDRVRTMALVHEKLYQTEDLARLDFAEYALSLLNYIWDSHSASNGKMRLNMSLSPLILPVGTVVLCGLILNELASNTIKHAFPDGRGGDVTVTLEHNPATGAVSLRVRDNGVGLPADLDWRQTNSLGLRLVQMLAKQMRGTVETGPGPGTEFQINFNVTGIPS